MLDLPPGVGGMPKAPGHRRPARGLARQARGHAGRGLPRRARALGRAEVRLRRGQVRARARRLDHRRQLPGARPHARAQRADRARVPAMGDVRRARRRRALRALRGRGRHGRDVLHLQVDEDEPAAQRRRHDRARHADLHALSRDAAPRGLRPQDREHPGEAGEPLAVRRRGAEEAARSDGQGVLRRQPEQPDLGGHEQGEHREDRRDLEEAARPDPAHRRRLRHLRAGLPLAARRVPVQHDRRLFVSQVLRLHGLAARRDRRARGQRLRRPDREALGAGARARSTSATPRSRSSRARSSSSTGWWPTAATWR